MAPQAQSNSQQILLQAAKQLQDAVKETGSSAGPFAMALLEVIESSSKLQEFDEMAKSAQENEAAGEEAQTWREISLMTLQYCRQGLEERQRTAIKELCKLADGGASLFQSATPVAQPSVGSPTGVPSSPPGLDVPQTPLGAPPGLELPAAEGVKTFPASKVAPPPGFGPAAEPTNKGTTKKQPPWRRQNGGARAPVVVAPTVPAPPVAALASQDFFTNETFWDSGVNLDAYSDTSN